MRMLQANFNTRRADLHLKRTKKRLYYIATDGETQLDKRDKSSDISVGLLST